MNALKSSREDLSELAEQLIAREMNRLSQLNQDERGKENPDQGRIDEHIHLQKQLEAKQSSLSWLDEHALQELVHSLEEGKTSTAH